MFTRKFWKDAFERAVKTAAQAGIAAIGTATVLSVSWPAVLAIVATATLLSVLTSITTNAVSDTDTASLVVDTVEK